MDPHKGLSRLSGSRAGASGTFGVGLCVDDDAEGGADALFADLGSGSFASGCGAPTTDDGTRLGVSDEDFGAVAMMSATVEVADGWSGG